VAALPGAVIAFIVPAHNEARLLPATLRALREAADALGIGYRIVVVDDASDDSTGDMAQRHGAQVVRVEHRHIAATRNAGAHATAEAWLCFVDADTVIDATVLAAALAALRGGAVGGGARVELLGPLAWHERLGQSFFAWTFRLAGIAPGCFLFCTRAAFDAAGGFDTRYYAGEDVALSRALARLGRFVILREPVRTSARKLRTFSAWEHLQLMLRFVGRRRRLLASREHLDLWYGRRRDERD